MRTSFSPALRQYALVTANYWVFTLTDGALRMLLILHFHQRGFSPLSIALLFVFYELFGVVTNLLGGWLGARIGLNHTMHIGLAMQIMALLLLAVPPYYLTVPWVMAVQAISGTAKDLNKMSAKSSIKVLVPANAAGRLYRWVAVLTGSKNALKGVGFFLGGALLAMLGFRGAVLCMAGVLAFAWLISVLNLQKNLGKMQYKPKFSALFSSSRAVNYLSAARLFLFGARDVWFVVALPVYFSNVLGWHDAAVGAFFALWVIGYGAVQAIAPYLTGKATGRMPDGKGATQWAIGLFAVSLLLAMGFSFFVETRVILLGGVVMFGAALAVNASLHSYLILYYAKAEGVSLAVGFYYMANAMGRLLGTVLSGWVYQIAGLGACLWISAGWIALAALISHALPRDTPTVTGLVH